MHFVNTLIILSGLLFNFYRSGTHNLVVQDKKPQVVDLIISHVFGEQIDLQAKLDPNENINKVVLFIASENRSILARESLTPSPDGEVYYIYNVSQNAVNVFSELSIWFEIEMVNGTVYDIEPTTYFYDDNRFNWRSQKTDEFSVFWYQDDPDLGQKILTTAYESLSRINSLVQVPSPDGINIFAYASVVDLQDTLKYSGEATSWIAGHADPNLSTIVVSLPPGSEQIIEIRRQIPHELTHILLYQRLGTAYKTIPRWLNEGLASSAELSPSPEYQLLINKAYERDSLIPIEDLCDSFPIDAANFQLAYAEASAFTQYLLRTYGSERMEELIQAFAHGQTCNQAVLDTFEQPLSEIEKKWRQVTFSEPPGFNIGNDTISLMVLIGFAFIVPIGLIFKGFTKKN